MWTPQNLRRPNGSELLFHFLSYPILSRISHRACVTDGIMLWCPTLEVKPASEQQQRQSVVSYSVRLKCSKHSSPRHGRQIEGATAYLAISLIALAPAVHPKTQWALLRTLVWLTNVVARQPVGWTTLVPQGTPHEPVQATNRGRSPACYCLLCCFCMISLKGMPGFKQICLHLTCPTDPK